MHFPAFAFTLLIGIAALVLIQVPPNGDPFAKGAPREGVEDLMVTDRAALKLRHAESHARFDIGLFGNSRSEEISAHHFGLTADRFFNFSLRGASIRQSLALLELLAQSDRLPKVVLVQLDNQALQFFPNPLYPGPPLRWHQAVRDIAVGIRRPEISTHEIMRMTYRHFLVEWWMFNSLFSVPLLVARSSCCRPGFSSPLMDDGSWPTTPLAKPNPIHPLEVLAPVILDGFLVNDLRRLAKLNSARTTVLVYESPLHPSAIRPSTAFEERTRETVAKACSEFQIVCLPHPRLGLGGGINHWRDSSHPPPDRLGPWLSEMLFAMPGIMK